jgi:hypothetical protein
VSQDTGSIVLGWLARVTLALAAMGLVGFELLSVGVTHVTVADIGNGSADAAQTAYAIQRNAATAYTAAEAFAKESGAHIPKRSFTVNPDGSMQFTVVKTAPTLVLRRIGPLAHLAVVEYSVDAPSLESSGTSP